METMTKKEVCARLKIAPRTLETLVKDGKFPPGVYMGKSVFWAEEVVEKRRKEHFKAQLEWKPRH